MLGLKADIILLDKYANKDDKRLVELATYYVTSGPNEITVVVHGNKEEFVVTNKYGEQITLSPNELAEIIKDYKEYTKDKTIILESCETGSEGGPAEDLHDILGNPVYAPKERVIPGTKRKKNVWRLIND